MRSKFSGVEAAVCKVLYKYLTGLPVEGDDAISQSILIYLTLSTVPVPIPR